MPFLRKYFPIILAFLFALVLASEFAVAAIPAPLDLRSAPSICGCLLSLSKAHPTLVTKMQGEGVDLACTLAGIRDVPEPLKQAALERSTEPLSLFGIEYVMADSWQVAGVDVTPQINNLPSVPLKNIRTDVHAISDRKQLLAYFTMAPFLYSAEGEPTCAQIDDGCKEQLRETLSRLSVLDLRDRLGFNRFDRAFRGELNPALVEVAVGVESHPSGLVPQIFQSFRNNFIQKGVGRFVPEQSKLQSVFLEELHPLVGLYRSYFAADSQTKRSSLFVLLDSVRSFKINSIEGGQVRTLGHLLIVEVNLAKERVPFLIGINGVLVSEDIVPSVMQLVSARYRTSHVLVPNYDIHARLTDQNSVRNVLGAVPSTPVQIDLGNGWQEIRKILQAKDPVLEHENALFASIESVNLVDVTSAFPVNTKRLFSPAREYLVPSPYRGEVRPNEVASSIRSILYLQIKKAFPEFSDEEIGRLLGI